MIINKGKKVIIGTPEEIRDAIAGQPVLQVTLKKLDPKIVEAVKNLKQVKEVNVDDSATRLLIAVDDLEATTPRVVRSVVNADGKILTVNILRPSLEEAYIKLVREEQS